MDAVEKHLKKQIKASLADLIDQAVATLDEEVVAQLVSEELERLGVEITPAKEASDDPGSPAPEDVEVAVSWEPERQRIRIQYQGDGGPGRARKNLFEDRAMMVELSQTPPLMESLDVEIAVGSHGEGFVVQGRVVHAQGSQVALELFTGDGDVRQRLEQHLDAPPEEAAPAAESASPTDSASQQTSSGPPVVDCLVDRSDAGLIDQWAFDGEDRTEIFFEVARGQSYRVLEVDKGEERYHFLFHHQSLIGVRRDPCFDVDGRLQNKLRRRDDIADEDWERARVIAKLYDISVQDGLIDIGAITVEELIGTIEACLSDHLQKLWEMTEGHSARLYELEGRPPLRLRRASIPVLEFMLHRLWAEAQTLDDGVLQALEARLKDQQFHYDPPPALKGQKSLFSGPKKRFVEVILAEDRSLSELSRITQFRRPQCLRLLWLLEQLNALALGHQDAELPEHSRIRGLYKGLGNKTAFEILDLHWSAYDEVVTRAYETMRQRLEVPPAVRQDLGEELAELEEAVDEAYELLSDRRQRKQLRDRLTDRLQRQGAIELYERKFDGQEIRGSLDEVEDTARRILELRPTHEGAQKRLHWVKHKRS